MRENEVRVYMFSCGDDECDCHWPIVDKRENGVIVGIAIGPFITYGYGSAEPGDKEAQDAWLAEAREWYHQGERQP